jgi:hypothetical protein
MTASTLVHSCLATGLAPTYRGSVSAWAAEHVRLPLSARSERFDPSITPWTTEPMDRLGLDGTRRVVFVKPIQAGGSVIGEVALCYWVSNTHGGTIQMLWQNDEHSDERWDTRVSRILKACKPVMQRWPQDRFQAMKGLVLFPFANLTSHGVYTQRRVASTSVKYQICEEVHDEEGWLPGRLSQAFGRLTAHWDAVSIVISNAGRKDCELHKVFEEGTQQHWEVKCPGCGNYHAMRTRWEDKRPELGGLRYDSTGCKREDGGFDYQKLASTLRYQMPCGYEVHDTVSERRALSLSGRYGPPQNPGAPTGFYSYTLQGVAVDYIPWLTLVQDKHAALRAMRRGDPEPWRKYLRERECVFAGEEDRPLVGRVVLSDRKKDRGGLPNKFVRVAALDRQQGKREAGELPHWWCVIRDFTDSGDSLLVYEGKLLTDEEAHDVMVRHDVRPQCVAVDSGDDTTHVYQFCLRHGYNAIKGEKSWSFAHEDGGRRIFSPERPLHLLVNQPATREDPGDEPLFWLYSKHGIRERLHWLRASTVWEVPSDVSQDYQRHMESEQVEERKDQFGSVSHVWVQVLDRNDLFVCECYCAMLAEMAGVIGSTATATEEKEDEKK